jgi:polynucleotide 5'-kinase involved in rRNA processing
MMNMDFLEKVRNGLYMLNPEYVAVVKKSQRKKLFDRYTQYKTNRLEEERQKQKREEAKRHRQTTIDEQISRSA